MTTKSTGTTVTSSATAVGTGTSLATGKYLIQAVVNATNGGGADTDITCNITASGGTSTLTTLSSGSTYKKNIQATIPLMASLNVTAGPTTVNVSCILGAASTGNSTNGVTITAIPVSAIQ
jgi:hypothetical protein